MRHMTDTQSPVPPAAASATVTALRAELARVRAAIRSELAATRTGGGKRGTRNPGESPHSGVVLIPPNAARRKATWSMRWQDPDTECRHEQRIEHCTHPTRHRAAAVIEAKRRAAQIAKAKLEISLGRARRSGVSIDQEIVTYMQSVTASTSASGRRTQQVTLDAYAGELARFAAWMRDADVTTLDDLTAADLSAWKHSRVIAKARAGAGIGTLRKSSTVNQEIKPARQMLIAARKGGRLLALDSDAINGALERLVEGRPEPRCLTVPEIKQLLAAAIAMDADLNGRKNGERVAPSIAVGLLTGLRRGELGGITVGAVQLDVSGDFIDVPKELTKNYQQRDVEAQSYSPMLGVLLRALIDGRADPSEPLLDLDDKMLGSVAVRLRKYGAPADFNIKTLRSTCASYQLPLPGDLKRKADRQGHTLAVAAKHYLSLPRGTALTAASLEAVMCCAEEIEEIIKALRASRATRSRRRAE